MARDSKVRRPLVSVIIPVYNCEEYIQRCLDSLYAQTSQDFVITAINDGSTDGSLAILERNANTHAHLTVVDQPNHGQGYTRNRALEVATTEYIMFVDADDYIEPTTIEKTLARAEDGRTDVVHFDWKMLTIRPGGVETIEHFNTEPFAHKQQLVGAECDEFLRMNNFFSVNNLYRRSFLIEKGIRYGEGHIYEDNIFMVQVGNRATKIALINEPLYVIRHNQTSSTRTGAKTDKHYKDFIRAARKSFEVVEPRTNTTLYYLASYFLEKFIIYYERRVPQQFKRAYLRDFVDLLASISLTVPDGEPPKKLLDLCIRRGIFRGRKYSQFRTLVLYKTVVLPRKATVLSAARKMRPRTP